MRLLDRFNILRNGGVIDRETHEQLQKILLRLEEQWQLPINDYNGAGLMTYIALMLMRFKRNEVSATMPSELFDELKEDKRSYKESLKIIEDIESIIGMQIPESEQQYLIANNFTILNSKVER